VQVVHSKLSGVVAIVTVCVPQSDRSGKGPATLVAHAAAGHGHTGSMTVGRRLEQQRTSLSLPTDDTAPSRARRTTRQLLSQWGLEHLSDTVLVVVSELVTNAVRHGRPPVSMSFRYDGARLAVGVHDSQPPHASPHGVSGPDAESGRGLFIISALGSTTGSRHEPTGKVVWVELDVRDS